ncbi:MAG: DUF4124 domain-containing protein [Desulfobacterales bacterium]|nr:DUF4124 domain-containing protein [Desulfobacterales bacterium]
MKRACMLIGLCLAVLLFANPALGEFYKYRDSSGVLRFTDNLAQVPLNQRPGAKSYKEADDYLTPYQKQARAEKTRREAEMEAKKKEEGTFESVQQKRMELNSTRTELDKEYGELMREKKALKKAKAESSTPEERAAYKKRVNALNERIIAYEGRRDQYEKDIKDVNARARKMQ